MSIKIICLLVAVVCFGAVGYGYYSNSHIENFWTYAGCVLVWGAISLIAFISSMAETWESRKKSL
jgi:hypothetical protein